MNLAEKSEWATFQLREQPFWCEGMTPEEFDEERSYLIEHWNDLTKGIYLPLWVQKGGEEVAIKWRNRIRVVD